MFCILFLCFLTLSSVYSTSEHRLNRVTMVGLPTLLFLSKCVNRQFPASTHMNVFAHGCMLLKDKLEIGNRFMEVKNIRTGVHAHREIEGQIDMSRFFHGASGLWNFNMKDRNGEVMISATHGMSAAPAEVPLEELLKASNSVVLRSEGIRNAISTLGLDTTFSINRFDFSVAPAGFYMTGSFSLDGMKVPTTICFELSGKMGLLARPTLAYFNNFQARAFGVDTPSVAPFDFRSVHYSLATSSIDVSRALQPTDQVQHLELAPGLRIEGSVCFNSHSPNALITLLGHLTKPFSFSFVLSKPDVATEFALGNIKVSEQVHLLDTHFILKPKLSFSHVAVVFESIVEYKVGPSVSLLFATSIKIVPGMKSVHLPLRLVHPWEEAFGIKQFTISQIDGTLQFPSNPNLEAAIHLQGSVSVGTITGAMNAYLHTNTLVDNCFSMQVVLLSVSQMLSNFFESNNWQLPLAIQATVFNNVQLTYAFVAIPERGIPAGLNVAGSGNIFGILCTLSVGVTSSAFEFSATMNPAPIGGLSLTSETDSSIGPSFSFDASVGSPVSVQVNARLNSFFFASVVTLNFDSTGISFGFPTVLFTHSTMVQASITATSFGFTASFVATSALSQAVRGYLTRLVEDNGITDDTTKLVNSYAQDFALSVSGDLRAADTKQLTFSVTFNHRTLTFTFNAAIALMSGLDKILAKIKDSLTAGLKSLAKKLCINKRDFANLELESAAIILSSDALN